MRAVRPWRRASTVAVRGSGGLPAARISRKRLTRGSSGICAIAGTLQSQRLARARRPLGEVQSVIGEHGHGQAVDTECHAAGMRQLALVIADAPDLAEVFAVV